MQLTAGGIDVFYVDESARADQFSFSAVTIPLLRNTGSFLGRNRWEFVWEIHLDAYRTFRRNLRAAHGVPVRKELHAFKLAAGRGRYGPKRRVLGSKQGPVVYRWILAHLDQVVPSESVITVVGDKNSGFHGMKDRDAGLVALFQRMQRQCRARNTNGMTFFDQGHGEYVRAYRKARRYLPTGSASPGGWSAGLTKNLEMTRFFKDGNIKDSFFSAFVQIADLIAYAATMLRAGELGTLAKWQQGGGLGSSYDDIPRDIINLNAAKLAGDARGIVRLHA